jgi:hypothetical protein
MGRSQARRRQRYESFNQRAGATRFDFSIAGGRGCQKPARMVGMSAMIGIFACGAAEQLFALDPHSGRNKF